jgi:hypothetical protein
VTITTLFLNSLIMTPDIYCILLSERGCGDLLVLILTKYENQSKRFVVLKAAM